MPRVVWAKSRCTYVTKMDGLTKLLVMFIACPVFPGTLYNCLIKVDFNILEFF